MTYQIKELLKEAVERGASDLHISSGRFPMLRLDGRLQPLEGATVLDPSHCAGLVGEILNHAQQEEFKQKGELDLAYALPGLSRFRVNVYRQQGRISAAFRVLNSDIPELGQLGLPETVTQLARRYKGLILVTGPTGSGKSTTLASLINLVNLERSCHILTLEDPIEYVYPEGRSLINQREIGRDSTSFARALRSALRQDPDVILVGEMRDLETISIAITAAETGHLVLATLHTVDAPQTIDRVIDVFPPHQQQQVRVQLASNLVGVVAQQLLPRKNGGGRVPAVEVLIANPAIRNLIREGKIHQIHSSMQTGGRLGMQTMDSSLRALYERGVIDYNDAVEHAVDPENFKKTLRQAPAGAGLSTGMQFRER